MTPAGLESPLAALPKAELHLHLEGSIAPETASLLAKRHGVFVSPVEVTARYAYHDFHGFLEAFKWVTSFLREPEDYGLITRRLAEELERQNVVYAEVTISAGVMLHRRQDVEKNFAAIRAAGERSRPSGLRLQWIFDATRQFGHEAAMEVAHWAARCQSGGVVALGLGGDELAYPASDFRAAYDFARGEGLHAVAHAGEVGGPESIRSVVDQLGAERVGHGIAAHSDSELMGSLAARRIPLENCIASNLRTGALARQLEKNEAQASDHPLKVFLDRGIRVVLSTDDPAMFHTDLLSEYRLAAELGLSPLELARLARASFEAAFLPPDEKRTLLDAFDAKAKDLAFA
jgi:aminodeoxyfutalosine deaminase